MTASQQAAIAATDDPVTCYLRDIATTPVLDREQEIALFARVKSGDAAAFHTIIEAHLKMVVIIARHHHGALPLADRIEEGNLGLMHAARKFRPDYGCRFATYAVWWVRAYIERAIHNQSSIVRVPVHIRQEYNAIRRAELALSIQYNRAPTVEEIANQMETGVSHVEELLYRAQPQRLVETVALSDSTLLDEHLQGDDPRAQAAPQPEQELEQKQHSEIISRWLDTLKPRERMVICARFGLENQEERTLEAIGGELLCTKERVRQIQVAALRKLRRHIATEQEKGAPDATATFS